VTRDADLSILRQCDLLALSRSTIYAQPSSDPDLALLQQIDELHLTLPFYGSRRICDELCKGGIRINRKKVQRLMQILGIQAVGPKPSTDIE